jgi:outer membrane protein OmpA-like peptidoglycan-associated protein
MKACNDALFLPARAVCQNSRQRPGSYAYDQCMYAVNLAEVGLPQRSQGPFDQRQREYCACCQPGPGRGNAASPPIDFLTGKTELDEQAKTVINDFLTAHQFVLAGTAYTLTLQGQASRLGDDQRNQELSDKRVAAVRAEIEKQLKMVGGTIVVASLGEQLAALEAPADPNEDAQEHRSVEIILVWP